MKPKFLVPILLIALICALLPSAALAADDNGDGFNDHDMALITTFLEKPSALTGRTNAEVLGYNTGDPSTWTGITWTSDAEKSLMSIDWPDYPCAGTLDLSGCASLDSVTITVPFGSYPFSEITSISVANCASLRTLDCPSAGSLTSLSLSGCTALETLECERNALTSLDISGLTSLKSVSCEYNGMTSLNFAGCTALETLECGNNSLTSLDVSGLSSLKSLSCEFNTMTSLITAGCTALETLECRNNSLDALNISDLTALKTLYCNFNSLISLDVSGCSALQNLNCSANRINTLVIGTLPELKWLDCTSNGLQSLNIGGCGNLTGLYCDANLIEALDFSACPLLEEISCYDNRLTSLTFTPEDANGNRSSRLKYFDSEGNDLTSLTVDISDPANIVRRISLGRNGNGYVSMFYNDFVSWLAVTAVPTAPDSFLNWTDRTGQTVPGSAYLQLTGEGAQLGFADYELTANFTNAAAKTSTYTVSYHPNGGTGTVPVDMNRYYKGDKVTPLSGAGLTKAGYVFTGWALADGTPVTNPFTMGSQSVTLYAVWTNKANIPLPPKTGDPSMVFGAAMLAAAAALVYFLFKAKKTKRV